MKSLSDFYDHLLPSMRGLVPEMADVEIRAAIIRLMEEGKVFVKALDALPTAAGTPTYPLVSPAAYPDHRVVEIKEAALDGDLLSPATTDQLSEKYDDWQSETGTPLWYLSDDPTTITLVPEPTAVGQLTARAAIVPNYDLTQVEDVIFNTYLRDIIHGAKGTLFAMNDKPWANGDLAGFHMQQFEAAIGSRSIQAHKGFQRARLRSKPVFR